MIKSLWQAWRAWIFGIPILLAIFSSIIALSPSFQACRQENNQLQSNSQKPKESQPNLIVTFRCLGRYIDTNHDTITAIATFFIALFTITLWWVAAGQYDLLDQQIKFVRNEFFATHRPRIILRDITVDGTSILYLLVNVGDTEATVIESGIMAEFVPDGMPLRPLRSAGHDDLKRLIIAGGETKELNYVIPNEIGFALRYPDTRRSSTIGRDSTLAVTLGVDGATAMQIGIRFPIR